MKPSSTLDSWLKELIPKNAEEWSCHSSFPSMLCDNEPPLEECCDHLYKVNGLYKDSTMTSFRTGPVMECLCSQFCTETEINQRGGWSDDCGLKCVGAPPTRMAKYIRPDNFSVYRAGLVLSGWKLDRSQIAISPTCKPILDIDESNLPLVQSLKAVLFHFPTKDFYSGDLTEFTWVVTAAVLMYYELCIKRYGVEHPIVVEVSKAAMKVGISIGTLKLWGRTIYKRWRNDNRVQTELPAVSSPCSPQCVAGDNLVSDVMDRLDGIAEKVSCVLSCIKDDRDHIQNKSIEYAANDPFLSTKGTEEESHDNVHTSVTKKRSVFDALSKEVSLPQRSSIKDLKDLLPIVFQSSFNVYLTFKKRDVLRVQYVLKNFLLQEISEEDRVYLKQDFYSPQRRERPDFEHSLRQRDKFINDLYEKLKKSFNLRWMAYLAACPQASSSKKKEVKCLTINNLEANLKAIIKWESSSQSTKKYFAT